MKKIVFFLFLCFFINTINALELCTPSDEYLEYMSLDEEAKKMYIEPAYCKELIEKEEINSDNGLVLFFNNITKSISASMTDSYYNAYEEGLINPSENQGDLGTCWAFSSLSAVEANAKKNNIGNYNFSESHVVYSVLSSAYSDAAGKIGKYKVDSFNGGKVTYAASYFLNHKGQLLESEMPYTGYFNQINYSQYNPGRNMISLGGFSIANIGDYGVCSNDEINYIKNQVALYGSVQVSMYMKYELFKDNNKNYYISTSNESTLANHGVSIVGWDDNVSGSNFGVSRNGAFIVKNSWGPTWSGDGLFYISYDDHFICKNTASFFDVSSVTFDNTYAASDVLGIPSFTFNNSFYTSARFRMKTSSESLKRISFPVAQGARYTVYLVTDNNLLNTSSWQYLTSGTSSVFGIRSVSLNKTINDDFTVVVKYETTSPTSVFTMCNNIDDTSDMNYSSNTNFYSVDNGLTWLDMDNIRLNEGTKISCEPNIYAYSNNISTPSTGSIAINSITTSNGKFTVSFTNNNIPTDAISYLITSNNMNVTSHFTITPNYSTNKVTIQSDGKVSGTFIFYIKYGDKSVNTSFILTESVSSNNTSVVNITNNNIKINITNNYTLNYNTFLSYLNVSNSEVRIYNASNDLITSTSSVITTNCKLKLNNKTYLIVIMGDTNCDGKVTALDYLEVRKHIMGSTISDTGKILAGDLDANNKITALDYIAIRKIIMR